MTRWLFATELGGGLGHLMRMRRLARTLVGPADRLTIFASDGNAARAIFGARADIRPVPVLSLLRAQPRAGFGGILDAFGFGDPARLLATTAEWRRLFARIRPDVLIADFAPFATFAARGMVPTAVIGSGFDLPPVDRPRFPSFMTGEQAGTEARLLQAARHVADRVGAPRPTSLPQAVGGDQRHLIGLPWLDPFMGRRREPALGPIGARPPLVPAPATARIFAYADPIAPSFTALIHALTRLRVDTALYWRGGQPAIRPLLADQGFTLFDAPPDPATELPVATLVISHGGAGLMADALFAGRPHLCLPFHREAEMNAHALETLGSAVLPRDQHAETLYWTIRAALEDVPLRDRALTLGAAIHDRFPACPAPMVARAIRRLAR